MTGGGDSGILRKKRSIPENLGWQIGGFLASEQWGTEIAEFQAVPT